MSRQIALLVSAAVLISVGARAQSSFVHDVTWSWPASLGSQGTLKRTACGDVTGDARPDLFVRGGESGQGITFFSAPGGTATSWVLAPTCNDFDIAPRAGTGGLDVLVFVDGNGLSRLDFSIASQQFEAAAPISNSSAWQGAVLVRSADVNASGVADYVGLKANRTTITYRRDTGPVTWTETTFSASGVVKEMHLIRWLVGQPLAVALRLGDGFEVRELGAGTLLGFFTCTDAVDAIAVVPTGGALADRIALLTHTPGGSERLRTFRRSLTDPECNVEIEGSAGLVASSLAVGDMDADADHDIVVSWTTTNELRVLTNTAGVGALPYFPSIGHQAVTWSPFDSSSVFPNEAQIVFRDTDNDGKADILFPIRHEANSAYEGRLVRLERTGIYVTGCGAFSNALPELDVEMELEVNVSLGRPLSIDGMTFPPGADRYLEVLLWEQIPEPTPWTGTPTNPAALQKYHYPILPLFTGVLPSPNYPAIRVLDIWVEAAGCQVENVSFVEFREVIALENRTYHAGETFTFAVTSHDEMNHLMESEPGACHFPVLDDCHTGSGEVRSHVRIRRPGPPHGQVPTVPQPTLMPDRLQIVVE